MNFDPKEALPNLLLSRFFNSEIHFSNTSNDNQIITLLESLSSTPKEQRKLFFEALINCRRRLLVGWEKAPIADLFIYDDQNHLLKFSKMSEKVKEKLLT